MITAIIRNNENTLVLDLPRSIYDLYEKLQSVGIMRSPKQIPLTDSEGEDIGVKLFSDNDFWRHLNSLAQRIAAMSEAEQTKFKAVLDAEDTTSIQDALNVANNLWRYEFTAMPDTADAFFKDHVAENADTRFDSRWLDGLFARNEGERLLGRLGATLTDYGVISTRNGHLFELVPYDEPEVKEIKTQAMTDEKLEVIEILDRKALFSNGRLLPEEVPEGLYAYDLRHSDDGRRFCSVEPKVAVNHGGTILLKEALDFGEQGYIALDEDTEPNFTGEEMTAEEFAEEETLDESMQMGGM